MPRKRPPELTFHKHIADYLVREHRYGVLEQQTEQLRAVDGRPSCMGGAARHRKRAGESAEDGRPGGGGRVCFRNFVLLRGRD